MERDCESELSKLNIEQNACIYHFGASVIHGQRSNILRLRHYKVDHAITATQKTILGAFGIEEGTILAKAVLVGKELENAFAPETEEDENGTNQEYEDD